jgi:hypothetical protein
VSVRDRHVISDRRLATALEKEDGDQMTAVRELLDEVWNRAFSAGQMKERLSGKKKGEW